MTYILLVGAYERDNFGDILLGKLFEKILNPIPCLWGSLMGRDMRAQGGAVAFSISDARPFLRQDPPCAVIHCGGETIAAETFLAATMDLDIRKPPDSLKDLQQLTRIITNRDNSFAYVNGRNDLFSENGGSTPIGFISIGGVTRAGLTATLQVLMEQAQFLSVRDRESHQFLQRLQLATELHADAAHLVSTYFPKDRLAESNETGRRFLERRQRYIVFQSSERLLAEWSSPIVTRNLVNCCEALDCDLVLQPAGIAALHDRLDSLFHIAEQVRLAHPKIRVEVQADRSIWAQLATIANCACWVGASLHGRIAALAYRRPCVSLVNPKVDTYVESWPVDTLPAKVRPPMLEAVERAIAVTQPELEHISTTLASSAAAGVRRLITALNVDRLALKDRKTPPHFDATAVLSAELDRLRAVIIRLSEGQK